MEEFSDVDTEPIERDTKHFNRTVRALFKKSFLIKVRRPMSIVEFCIATVLWVVLYPCYVIACQKLPANVDPELVYNETIPSPLSYFFTTYSNATFVIAPDCNNTRVLVDLFNYSMIASLGILGSRMMNGSTNASNATLLSSPTNNILYDIQSHLKPEINSFIDKYSRHIIESIIIEIPNHETINYQDTDFEVYIKLSIIEGLFTHMSSNKDQFNIEKFIKNNVFNYFNSILTIPNIDKIRQIIAKGDDGAIESAYIQDYIQNFNQTILKILKTNSQFTSDVTKYFQKPKIDWNLINYGFEDDFYNMSEIDENQTEALLREYYNFQPVFVNDVDEVKNEIYQHTNNGFGIYWVNAKEVNATLKPNIQTYYQSLDEYPGEQLFNILIRIVSYMNGEIGYPFDFSIIEYQSYPYPAGKNYYDISILVGIIVVFPIVIASMCDLQILLEEKDNHVMILSFLMGCSETAYFLVGICMQFLSSIFSYVLMCVFYCFVFIFKGTSFTLMLVITLLFMLSHIAFLMFLTTFMKKARTGRAITVIFLVFTIFFSFVHFFYTLDESNHSNVSKHVFSIIPLSCYEMAMISMFKQCRAFMKPVDWSMLRNHGDVNLVYQMWFALMWLSVDLVFYFLLFLLFNLTNPRDFGSPPIKWREIFKKKAWKRVFSRRRILKLKQKASSGLYNTNTNLFDLELLKVENLSKTYHGHRTVTAISNVNFTIYQNEVIVVIGPNGAGKSTLINILSGALQPTTGTLSLYKEPPTESFNEIKNILGVCFQDNVIIETLSIKENMDLFGAFRNIPKPELKKTTNFFAETLQLKEMLDTRTGDLSGGQKRKVCISLSLLGNPPLVIMDEPTAGVDVQARQLIWKVIASLKNTTTIVTSHALEEAEAVSSRLFVVAGGGLPFAGTATEFRNTFKCGYILRVESSLNEIEEEKRSPSTNNTNDYIVNNDNDGVINLDEIEENQNNMNEEKMKDEMMNESNSKKKKMESKVFILDDDNETKKNSPIDKMKKFKRRRKRKKDEALNKLFESVYCDSDDEEKDQEVTENERTALRVLEFVRKYEPKAKMSRERIDSIRLPVSPMIPRIVNEIENNKVELGVSSYTIAVEQLEDVLLKLIMTEESSFNPNSMGE